MDMMTSLIREAEYIHRETNTNNERQFFRLYSAAFHLTVNILEVTQEAIQHMGHFGVTYVTSKVNNFRQKG